jgi:hypothetical protein
VTHLRRSWPSNPAHPSLIRLPITSALSNHQPCRPSFAGIDVLASSLPPQPPPPRHGLSSPRLISRHTTTYPLSVVHRNRAPTATAATRPYYYYFYVLFYSNFILFVINYYKTIYVEVHHNTFTLHPFDNAEYLYPAIVEYERTWFNCVGKNDRNWQSFRCDNLHPLYLSSSDS